MFYTFYDLSADEVKLIGYALGKLPYEVSQPLLAKLQTQIANTEASYKAPVVGAPDEAAPAE